ncbi:MAG: hypothetical protein UY77_C0040G0007 [Candidatus Uhrbacteria bacterium GW2011_GWA2_53_10]|uniref:FAD-binding domain-containing protein n=1 Tax=Candidatus Uhrbacteria bacterium GW2011_GWA2_53_10 TaxID=1618980 RepID=A0A0G1XL17_9BACT|nr:MAG: hypothetical protein UY77_C0040G0007 [Candidatus Uhrbacteria bacterium GW2011_GWA2_53_10]
MQAYDVVIVGASFAGLTLAHHLPKNLRVLVVDAKPEAGSTVESTGLITTKTRNEFESFFDIDAFITNHISSIGVVAPGYDDYFISSVKEPWIFQTDTKGLVKALADRAPSNVTVRTKTVFFGVEDALPVSSVKIQTQGKSLEEIRTRVLVGADGSHSRVAQATGLERNRRFLFGYEQVFFGQVYLGPCPEETIYHFWFGEFSLGYGGWLSPTIVDGHKAFRIGLAKLEKDRGQAKDLIRKFIQELLARKIISIDGEVEKPGYFFGGLIPIGGVLKNISKENVILVGDAAGFCGAFAADGIKGSVISGKEAAGLILRYLQGEPSVFKELPKRMNAHGDIMDYYRRQLCYRWVWDQMCRDETFRAMYDIINTERDTFLEQFCDSKDKKKSLTRTVLKPRHVFRLARYSWLILSDMVRSLFH